MGSMVEISCTSCGLDELHLLGVGMMGTTHEAYACVSCRALVTLSWSVTGGEAEPAAVCPTCNGPLSHIVEDTEPATPCPVCGGELSLTDVGLWD
jgi:hypothetical protein